MQVTLNLPEEAHLLPGLQHLCANYGKPVADAEEQPGESEDVDTVKTPTTAQGPKRRRSAPMAAVTGKTETVEESPFKRKYESAEEIIKVLDEAKEIREIAILYYQNAEMIEATPELKTKVTAKKNELYAAEKGETVTTETLIAVEPETVATPPPAVEAVEADAFDFLNLDEPATDIHPDLANLQPAEQLLAIQKIASAKASAGKKTEVKSALTAAGSDRLTAIPVENYTKLYTDLKAIA